MQTGFWAGFSVIHRLFVKPWNLSQVVVAKGCVWDGFKARRDIENKPLICHLTVWSNLRSITWKSPNRVSIYQAQKGWKWFLLVQNTITFWNKLGHPLACRRLKFFTLGIPSLKLQVPEGWASWESFGKITASCIASKICLNISKHKINSWNIQVKIQFCLWWII